MINDFSALWGDLKGFDMLRASGKPVESPFPTAIKDAFLDDFKTEEEADLMQRLLQACVDAGKWVGLDVSVSDRETYDKLFYYGYVEISKDGNTIYPTMDTYYYLTKYIARSK